MNNPVVEKTEPLQKSKKSGAEPSREKSVSPEEKPKRRTAAFGLVKRKEVWALSARGWCAAAAVVLALAVTFVLTIHPFLAVTDRVETPYLVVEGWVPNYALEDSIAEFKSRPAYTMMFTVGADPLTGLNIDPGDSVAIEAFKRLRWLGMNPDLVKPVPAHIQFRNRTFESASALRKYFDENHVPVTSLNVVTLGAHARRSRLLFEEAFKGKATIGIISVENREYNPKRWWKYSEGVREVLSEGISYLYARFFFHPENP